jgi:hypothetical protein
MLLKGRVGKPARSAPRSLRGLLRENGSRNGDLEVVEERALVFHIETSTEGRV